MMAWDLDFKKHLEDLHVHLKEQKWEFDPYKITAAISYSSGDSLLAIGDHRGNHSTVGFQKFYLEMMVCQGSQSTAQNEHQQVGPVTQATTSFYSITCLSHHCLIGRRRANALVQQKLVSKEISKVFLPYKNRRTHIS
jgi:hypothetical protein